MSDEADEPMLPYTPSHTGRRARVGYLGLVGVGFNGLWPLFGGLVASVALALHFFLGDGSGPGHWVAKTVLSALPASVGFCYLRFFVAGRPPHFKGDLWATVLGLRIDFSDPPLRLLSILPRISSDPAVAAGPGRAADLRHPMRSSGGSRRCA
ncbi:MAG TPA: hypothetical protein VGF85_09520 [Opitutaceae bacterium]|jgi:hypothetical protein